MQNKQHSKFHKPDFNTTKDIFDYFKHHYLVSALIRVEKEHGHLHVNHELSSITGLGFDATMVEREAFADGGRWAIKHFGLDFVGTYTVLAVLTHSEHGYTVDNYEVVAKVH